MSVIAPYCRRYSTYGVKITQRLKDDFCPKIHSTPVGIITLKVKFRERLREELIRLNCRIEDP